jgi:alkylhydroperoxidase family enzyme
VEFLRVASGEAALSLSVLSGEDEALPPRAAALARFATTLTAEPWALSRSVIDGVVAQGLSDEQIEAAVGVIAMFNYLTRVADATGIDFDYSSPLPTFQPDRCQVPSPRPAGPAPEQRLVRPRLRILRDAWDTWRQYVLETDEPISRRERQLVAAAAAEEAADRDGQVDPRTQSERALVEFARKLSRHPWTMEPTDLDELRALRYSDLAILHVISVTAHQNGTSRLRTGLSAARA